MEATRKMSKSTASSCASQFVPWGERIPPHLRHREGRFRNARGQSLFYFMLFPEEHRALRGVVLHLHGLGDHCRRYIFVYERLCAAGFGVITFDMVNHGASECDAYQTRAHVRKFQDLTDDANAFVTFAKLHLFPTLSLQGRPLSTVEVPLICAGISWGTLVAAHVVLSGLHEFRATVLSSPTLGTVWTPKLHLERTVLQPIALLMPTSRVVPSVDYEWICRDPGFLEDFSADPLTTAEMMTASTGTQTAKAMKQLRKAKAIEDPSSRIGSSAMLLLAGSLDNIADSASAVALFERMGNADKTFKLFTGMYHCVYEDPESDDVFEFLTKWLRERCPKITAESSLAHNDFGWDRHGSNPLEHR